MKDFTFNPLHSFAVKRVGVLITALTLLCITFFKIFGNHFAFEVETFSKLEGYLFLAFVFGLFTMAFSKERYEDERIQKIRGKAMQFGFMVSSTMGMAMFITYHRIGRTFDFGADSYLFVTCLMLIFYLLYFHFSVFFDFGGNYSDNSVGENIRKNKRFFLIYTALSLFLIVLSFIL